MTINDGGPAFPQNDLSGYGMGPAEHSNGGMTLRDWFAGQALAGMVANETTPFSADVAEVDPGQIADAVYDIADAMIAAPDLARLCLSRGEALATATAETSLPLFRGKPELVA